MTNLQAIRLERGLSLRAMAAELGVTHDSLRHWENGAYPHPPSRKKLCDGLGLPLYLILAPNEETSDLIGRRLLITHEPPSNRERSSLEQQ